MVMFSNIVHNRTPFRNITIVSYLRVIHSVPSHKLQLTIKDLSFCDSNFALYLPFSLAVTKSISFDFFSYGE